MNESGNGNRQRPAPYGSMRMPSIEERKTPYAPPSAQQMQHSQHPPHAAEHTADKKPDSAHPHHESVNEIASEAYELDFYPLAGRRKKASYGSFVSDTELFSALAVLVSMIIVVALALLAYGGYIFSTPTGAYIAAAQSVGEEKLTAASAVSPLSESDYFNNEIGSDYEFGTPVPVSAPVENDYFLDAVFIGDSRTEGLYLYSRIKSTFICERGLNVSKVFENALDKYDGKTAIEVLRESDCNKIYISFGINEIGWVKSAFVKAYGRLIDEIKAAKPDAIIIVQNIYPMSKEWSDQNVYGTNAKLAEYNEEIAKLCAEKEVYLLDVASYFADESGDLKSSYETGADGAHFKAGGQGYTDWTHYIKTHTVQP